MNGVNTIICGRDSGLSKRFPPGCSVGQCGSAAVRQGGRAAVGQCGSAAVRQGGRAV